MSILDLYMANSIDNTAGKIREKLNTVRNKRKVSAKRCIWEMMQNAKDVYNPKFGGVSIEFEIADEHTFIFRHNGLYFRLNKECPFLYPIHPIYRRVPLYMKAS